MSPVRRVSFVPAFPYRRGHVQTCLGAARRGFAPPADTVRTRLELQDGDFLDVDTIARGNPRAAIISHGLEGNSRRPYVLGMARALLADGWDCIAWNFRGNSGEANRLPRFTHNGSWDDLAAVVEAAAADSRWGTLALVGFSMGGNITLNYLGGDAPPHPKVRGAAVFSVPTDLEACADALRRLGNRLYMLRFMRSMKRRILELHARHPGSVSTEDLRRVRNFHDFDGRYTAPLHGFADARDYWHRCSAKPRIPSIRLPVLMLNAADDSFIPPESLPVREAEASRFLTLEIASHGGHCGFFRRPGDPRYRSEERALAFLSSLS